MRHPDPGSVAEFALGSRVPVINGGDGANEHPTQALLVLFTIHQELKRQSKDFQDLSLTLLGDLKHGRTVHSLCQLLALYKNLKIQVPHMGWNSLKIKKTSKLLKNVKEDENCYFVHSYYVLPSNSEYTVAVCKHGIESTAAFESENIMGVQFHPEKCSNNGFSILKQFSLMS